MKLRAAILTTLVASAPSLAFAQTMPTTTRASGYALDQLEPAPAGDSFFGVPSAGAVGHLSPRAMLEFDYASRPLRIVNGTNDPSIVSAQGILRADLALALFHRALFSVDVPVAIMQSSDEPSTPGVSFNSPSNAAFGDIRLGLRTRILGAEDGPIQLGLGGYFFIPSAPDASYTGDGSARGQVHAIVGGDVKGGVHLVYDATIGAMIRGSDNPSDLTFGGAIGVLLARDRVQIGPEIYGATMLGNGTPLAGSNAMVTTSAKTNLEALLGARVHLPLGVAIGVAGGPGLSSAAGTPTFRFLGSLGWAGRVEAARAENKATIGDRDGDGIRDDVDACPDIPGGLFGDPKRDGCPAPDRDHDGVFDADDACPDRAGIRSADPTKNGCPTDKDGDGIFDADDACPNEKGVPSADPKKNGCPTDRDGDGVPDYADACPDQKGERDPDPRRNGCSIDPDGDGIKYPDDACPFEKGAADPDPKQNGCPKYVRVTDKEIVIKKQVEFKEYGKTKSQTVDPVSDTLMTEVRDVIKEHPEILLIEVQGHTDDSGDPRFNQHLSEDRANAVRQWLIDAGIAKDKLVAKGYGSTRPVADNRIREGRQRNRRVQFLVIKKK